ncbi:MAG: glycosyltransferase family 4 protein [Treponema sp.]
MSVKKNCIGVDAFGCNHGMSGLGSYLFELINNASSQNCDFVLFGHEMDRYTYPTFFNNVSFEGINLSDTDFAKSVWHKAHLNSFIKRNKFDAVLYVSGFRYLPLTLTVPSFLVINDVQNNNNFISNLYIKHIINQVTGFITPSKYVKTSLLNLGVSPSKIAVIHNGVNLNTFKPMEFENKDTIFVQPFSIKRPYIIYASRLADASKSHLELIRAFNIFKKKTGSPHRLVIAGAEGAFTEIVREEVIHSHYSSDILLTGHFPHDALSKLYSASDLCIFPSRNEGSGLSVLETMASGIPTACSNEGALKEIAKDAVLYFDSTSPNDIADKIEKLVNTKENAKLREEMIKKGLECASQYSWKTTSKQTIEYIISKIKKA